MKSSGYSTKQITALALFTTIALAVYYAESLLPPIVPIPGIKLGLANIITLILIKKATLKITSLGCYYATLNGDRIGDFILAPGWTYYKRTQMQEYDITSMIKEENEIRVTLSQGWFNGRINIRTRKELPDVCPALICEIEILYKNGTKEFIYSILSFFINNIIISL